MRKSDANEREIVAALQRVGASVERIDSADSRKRGIPDLVVGHNGRTTLMEVKTPPTGPRGGGAGRLSPEQEAFLREWRGGPAVVVHTAEEALAAIGLGVPF